MIFTFPKVLRVFFNQHKTLYGEIARQVYAMIQRFYDIAAGSRFHGAAVIAYASTGEFARFHPHLHAIVLEGGFDRQGRFVHIPRLDLGKLSEYFRSSMVDFFLQRGRPNSRELLQDQRGTVSVHRPCVGIAEEAGRGGSWGYFILANHDEMHIINIKMLDYFVNEEVLLIYP